MQLGIYFNHFNVARPKLKDLWIYFSSVDGAHINSDKNIFSTSMNFDVGATISLIVKS